MSVVRTPRSRRHCIACRKMAPSAKSAATVGRGRWQHRRIHDVRQLRLRGRETSQLPLGHTAMEPVRAVLGDLRGALSYLLWRGHAIEDTTGRREDLPA